MYYSILLAHIFFGLHNFWPRKSKRSTGLNSAARVGVYYVHETLSVETPCALDWTILCLEVHAHQRGSYEWLFLLAFWTSEVCSVRGWVPGVLVDLVEQPGGGRFRYSLTLFPPTYAAVCKGNVIWVALRKKVPNVLSRCHTKRKTDACGSACPSFGMTPTFQKKKKKKKEEEEKEKKKEKFWNPPPPKKSFFWYDNDSGQYSKSG